MRLLKGIIVAYLLSHAAFATAAAIDDGFAAYDSGNHQKSFAILLPLAEKGDTKAQYYIAAMYAEGNGIKSDPLTAIKWYKLAAKQGHAASMYALGSIYFEGKGVTIDQIEAYKWFFLAKSFGDNRSDNLQSALARGLTDEQISQAKQMAVDWRKQNGL